MRHRIGRPRFMQSFASGGAGTPFASTTAVEVSFTPAGNISSTNVQAALQELDNEKVAKAGDTMTGFLVLNAPPVLDLQAATKKYVDDKVAAGGGYTDEMAMDAVAAMIKNGTNITWAYDDVLNSLTPTVNVTNMAAGSIGFTPAGNVGSNNVQAAIQELDNEKVAKAGDTMTGDLTVSKADAQIHLKSTAGTGAYITTYKANAVRWSLQIGNSAVESGSNTGSDFALLRFNDAGAPIDAPLIIYRNTGNVAINSTTPSTSPTTGAFTIPYGGVGIGGAVNTAGNVTIQKSAPRLSFDATDANGPYIEVKRNNVLRWFFYLAGDPETGSNVGSDFYIQCMNDAGGSVAFPLRIERRSGSVKLQEAIPSTSTTTGALTVAGGVGVAGALYTGGIIVIAKATPILYMNDLGGAGNYISAQKNGLSRWEMSLGSGTESGGNAGSDFTLNRYNDAGSLLGSAIVIRRNNGDMTVGGGFLVQSADPTMYLQKAADANVAQMYVMSSGAARWLWHYADQTNNNMQLYRCNAVGGIVDGPFGVNWATGKVAMSSNIPATSSTTGTLTVAGGLGVGGNIYAGAMIHSPAGITVSPSLPDTNHSMTFDAAINGPFISGFQGVALGIQGVKSLTITGSGQEMNLGTAVPGYKFGMTFPGGGTQYGFGIKQSADTTVAIQFINAGGGNMGNISTGTTTVAYNTSSDKRLKKNLKKFDSNKIVDAINVYDFEWKETGERSIGIVAQEVYEVYPQAITHDEKFDEWFVDYSKFAPLMLQELKSLRSRVKRLER